MPETNPAPKERTDTIDFAVSQLLKEPEQPAPLEEEPVDTAEPTEDEELEVESTDEDQETEEYEEESDYEEDDPEEGEQPEYFTVKADGEEFEVTLDELQSGYQRQKDYTKKTQALADQRKDYDAKAQKLEELQTHFLQQAQMANELLNRDLKKYESVDWETLKAEDPVGFLKKQIEVNDIRAAQEELRKQAQVAYEHNQKAKAEEFEQYLEMQRKELLTRFPDWKDSEKADAHRKNLIDYGKTVGYTEESLRSITDALDLVTLDKAMRYDKLMATKQGIAKKQTTPAIRKKVKSKGLAPKGAKRQKAMAGRADALRQTGSLKDAAAFLYEMRSGNEVRK